MTRLKGVLGSGFCVLQRSVLASLLGLSAVLVLFAGACSAADYGDKQPIAVAVNIEDPTWDNGIGELVARKCDNCHAKTPSEFVPGEVRDDPARYQLGLAESEETFLRYGGVSFSRVFETLDDPMPPKYGTPLSDSEKSALRVYFDRKGIGREQPEGVRAAFLRETCGSVTANTLTFASDVTTPAGTQGCTGCHSGPSPQGGLSLAAAADWKTHREALVWVLAKNGEGENRMPFGRPDDYTAAGQPGEILLRYLCGAAEITAE
jgi:hypothetical protein